MYCFSLAIVCSIKNCCSFFMHFFHICKYIRIIFDTQMKSLWLPNRKVVIKTDFFHKICFLCFSFKTQLCKIKRFCKETVCILINMIWKKINSENQKIEEIQTNKKQICITLFEYMFGFDFINLRVVWVFAWICFLSTIISFLKIIQISLYLIFNSLVYNLKNDFICVSNIIQIYLQMWKKCIKQLQ
jgi:hypothetical protein